MSTLEEHLFVPRTPSIEDSRPGMVWSTTLSPGAFTEALRDAKREGARAAVERIHAWAVEQTALADAEKRVAPLYEVLRILDEEASRA